MKNIDGALCRKCRFTRGVQNSMLQHRCVHSLFWGDDGGLKFMEAARVNDAIIPRLATRLGVTFSKQGVKRGHVHWPFSFDPGYLRTCNGFRYKRVPAGIPDEQIATMVAGILMELSEVDATDADVFQICLDLVGAQRLRRMSDSFPEDFRAKLEGLSDGDESTGQTDDEGESRGRDVRGVETSDRPTGDEEPSRETGQDTAREPSG